MYLKMIAGAYLLETHITGIRAHGRKTIMCLDCNDFRHDSNLTIEIILRMLVQFKVIRASLVNAYISLFSQDSLPRVLYIQMDNTCRDNKNKYTLMFAYFLVEFGVFNKVT